MSNLSEMGTRYPWRTRVMAGLGLLFPKASAIISFNMKKVQKVSVLVPIYNVEKYLRQCLESLVNQTLREIEIICLNDGSTDSSLDIIKEFAQDDERIVIVDKKNSGYGDSMNQGLKKATGEYIAIVESDDFIELDALEKLYKLAKTHDAEVVRANYYRYKGGKDKKYSYVEAADAGRIIDPVRHTWVFYQIPSIWSAIYKREFLEKNGIEFLPTPGASYQDTGFNFKVWASAHRVYFTTEAFLHYRLDNEASSVNNPGKVFNVNYEYAEIEKFLKERKLFDQLGPIMEIAKFGAYHWNINRLSPKLLPGFLKKVKEEYSEARAQDLLVEEYSAGPEQWKLMNAIIDHSAFYAMAYAYWLKMRTAGVTGLKKLWKLTHPSFRKQQELTELIVELQNESDMLERKLNELEEREDEKSAD